MIFMLKRGKKKRIKEGVFMQISKAKIKIWKFESRAKLERQLAIRCIAFLSDLGSCTRMMYVGIVEAECH